MHFRLIAFGIFSLIIAFAIIVFFTPLFNIKYTINENVKIHEGKFINISSSHSEINHFGHPLVFCIHFGVNQPTIYEWELDNIKYTFETKLLPIIIAKNSDNLFLVLSNKNSECPDFVFYKYHHFKWFVISAKEFPKKYAIQNIGISKNESHTIDLNSFEFSRSLTGQLWAYLETGRNYVNKSNKNYYTDFAKRNDINEEMLKNR